MAIRQHGLHAQIARRLVNWRRSMPQRNPQSQTVANALWTRCIAPGTRSASAVWRSLRIRIITEGITSEGDCPYAVKHHVLRTREHGVGTIAASCSPNGSLSTGDMACAIREELGPIRPTAQNCRKTRVECRGPERDDSPGTRVEGQSRLMGDVAH
jgi:hypothetical protein